MQVGEPGHVEVGAVFNRTTWLTNRAVENRTYDPDPGSRSHTERGSERSNVFVQVAQGG